MRRPFEADLPGGLAQKISRLRSHVQRLSLVRGYGILATVFAAAAGLGLIVDLYWELGVVLRIAMLATAGLVLAVAAWRSLLQPCRRRRSAAELAAIVEQTHPELGERLTSTVELNDPAVPEAHKGSALMRELLTSETLQSVAPLEFTDAVPSASATRTSLVGTCALVVLFTPFLLAPAGYSLLWSRFLVPWGNFDRAGNLYFHVENGDRFVARGTDVTIVAEPRWRNAAGEAPEAVWLNWTDSTGEADSRRMHFDASADAWTTTIPHVFNPFELTVSAKGGLSRLYRIGVVNAPELTETTLDVEPPAYTGLPAKNFDGAVGEMSVFEQSRLTFQLKFNKPVENAELIWFDGSAASSGTAQRDEQIPENGTGPKSQFVLSDDRLSATLAMTATRSGPFAIKLTDEHGLHNPQQPPRSLLITPDEPPRLVLAGSERPQQVRPDDVVSIAVTATDDVGIGALELQYEVERPHKKLLTVDGPKLGGLVVEHEFQLDLASLNLSEGSLVVYRVRAADERPVPAPHEVWSKPRVLAVNREAKPLGSDDVAERQQQLKRILDRIRDGLKQNHTEVAELLKDAESHFNAPVEFKHNDNIPPLSDEQIELAKRLEELAARFSEHPLFANLTPKTQQVARDDLAKSALAMKQAAGQPLPEKAGSLQQTIDALADAKTKLDDIAQEFDELAEIERDLLELNRLAQQAERLAEQTRALDGRRQNPPADETPNEEQARRQELVEGQQQLQKQQQELSKDLKDLLQRRPELIDAARKAQLDRLAELARRALEIAEPQSLLADALEEESKRSAPERNTSAQTENGPSQPDASGPSGQQVQKMQEQLAREAARLALETARRTGPNSKALKQAMQLVRLSGG